MASKFKYRGGGRSAESVSRRSRQSSGAYDSYLSGDVPMIKIKEGANQLRILPATWSTDVSDGWEIPAYVHYSVGPDNGAYLCREKMLNEECPICEAKRSAASDSEAKQMQPSFRALCFVIDRDNEKAGPQIWSMPTKVFRELNKRSTDRRTGEVILIDHQDKGYDIEFDREGSGLRTDYVNIDIDRDSTPVHDDPDVQEKWLDYISRHSIPDLLNFYEAEYIEKVLFGQRSASSSDDDEDKPRSRSKRRVEEDEEDEDAVRSRRREKDEDDTEDEDRPLRRRRGREEPEEEEDEEDEKPARRRRRDPDEEEDEEDDDNPLPDETDDDDDDADKPSRKAREGLQRVRSRRK